MCYWARLSGFTGGLSDIIGNGNSGLEIVSIAKSDAGFTTQGCGDRVPVKATFPFAAAARSVTVSARSVVGLVCRHCPD